MYHNRHTIDVHTAQQAREYFFDPIIDQKLSLSIIPGNHDLYWKELDRTSTLREIVPNSKYITILDTAATIDNNLIVVPWINQSNRAQTIELLNASAATVVFGHLELVGYMMYRGQVAMHGDDPAIFKKFQHVYTGHFHHKNSHGNVTYLGNNQQQTWSDYGDTRGFHIFDTDSRQIEFIANPYDMFKIINYDESQSVSGDWDDVEGMFVRVHHDQLEKKSKLDQYVKDIEKAGAVNVQIVSNKISANTEVEESQIQDTEDTVALFKALVDDPNVVSKLIKLYNTAQLIK